MSIYNLSRLMSAYFQYQLNPGRPVNPEQDSSNAPQFSIEDSATIPYQESPFALQALSLAMIGRSQVQAGMGQPAFDLTTTTTGAAPPEGSNGPAGIMDLSGFKLMLPTGQEGKPDMLDGADLASHKSPYFQLTDGKMQFFSPVNGATSANSDNTRSELGEADGWKMGEGQHTLSATLTMDQVPSSGDVTIGQVHQRDGKGGPPIMLRWKNGNVVASVLESNSPSANRKEYVLAENVPLGQQFSYKIDVAPDGSTELDVNGKKTNIKLDSSFKDSDMYFKAGVYANDNKGDSKEGARATFTQLQTGKAEKADDKPNAEKPAKE